MSLSSFYSQRRSLLYTEFPQVPYFLAAIDSLKLEFGRNDKIVKFTFANFLDLT